MERDLRADLKVDIDFYRDYNALSSKLLKHLQVDSLIDTNERLLKQAENIWDRENIDGVYNAWGKICSLRIDEDSEWFSMKDIEDILVLALDKLKDELN